MSVEHIMSLELNTIIFHPLFSSVLLPPQPALSGFHFVVISLQPRHDCQLTADSFPQDLSMTDPAVPQPHF